MSFALHYQSLPGGGLLRSAKVPWDSACLGMPVYQLEIVSSLAAEAHAPLCNWLRSLVQRGDCLVQAKVSLAARPVMKLLAEHGFYLVEAISELRLSLDRLGTNATMPTAVRWRPATLADLPELLEIVAASFNATRFHLDPHIPSSAADERMQNWLRNAFSAGEPVLVFEEASTGRTIGLFNYREVAPSVAYASLGAVAPRYRASPLVMSLFTAALAECRREGYTTVTCHISLNNCDSLNLMLALGFELESTLATFHWRSESTKLLGD